MLHVAGAWLFHQFQGRLAKGNHLPIRSRFQITAEHGFRTGGAEHPPTTVVEQEFVTVLCDQTGDLLPAEFVQPTRETTERLFLPLRRHALVDAITDDAAR